MRIATAYLALLFCFSSTCWAQAQTAPAASTRSTKTPSTKTDDSIVLIHGGTFQMGIDSADIPRFQEIFAIENAKLFEDELPRHTIIVEDFYMDKNLVANSQFKSFVDANPTLIPLLRLGKFDNGNYLQHWETPGDQSAEPDHPVVNINWDAAVLYCGWAGKRLPTEAEWEFAARGGKDALFPWGDELPDETRANFNNNVGTTTPVGSYPANPYGLFDMAGNVWQFLYDRWEHYFSDADNRKKQNTVALAEQQEIDRFVLHPNSARYVIRGGSFSGHPVNLWLEYRDSHPSNGSQPFVGFRCAKSVPAQPST
jgi:formylglycine-generating enzyme required for sulfatase activity